MQNLLIKYMEERLKKEAAERAIKKGPRAIITISREAGCSANVIADDLADELNFMLNQAGRDQDWRVVNKEVIEHAARDLELHPDKIKHVFKGQKKSLLDDMIFSMSTKYYKSDWKIRKSITGVINSFVKQGHVIIVGRAGVAIAQEHKKALHVKLQAPPAWRAEVISKKHEISIREAEKYISDLDKSRNKLLTDFKCGGDSCMFDLMLNCEKMSIGQVVEVILQAAKIKGLI
jgi:cytidylate kinase